MKFRNLYILVFFIFFVGCEQYRPNKSAKIELKPEKKYFNTGFALIYNQELDIKKLDNKSIK